MRCRGGAVQVQSRCRCRGGADVVQSRFNAGVVAKQVQQQNRC